MAAPYWRVGNDSTLDVLVSTLQAQSDDRHRAGTGGDDRGDGRRGRSRDTHAKPVADGEGDDAAVLTALRTGDRSALDDVYRATYADLWQFAYTYVRVPEVADEIVQDVFVTLVTRAEVLPQTGTIRGYLFTAVRNRALNVLRTVRRGGAAEARIVHDDTIAAHGSLSRAADTALIESDVHQAVAGSVRALPERQQRAVLLRYAARLSFAEIGDVLGVSPDGARMLVNRATTELRVQLADVLDTLHA